MQITGIITGDIVNSKKVKPSVWLPVLEKSLKKYSKKVEIYRGDSFQMEAPIESIFEAAFYLKACLKCIPKIDVRFGIGIGETDFNKKNIKKSNGEAFINSGEAFESLKKETITIKTPWTDTNETVNLLLELLSNIMDSWTINMANSVKVALENPGKNQIELAEILHKKYQSQISTELSRAGYYKILKAVDYCTRKITEKC